MRDKQSKNSGSKRFPKSGKNQLSFSTSQKTILYQTTEFNKALQNKLDDS